MRVLVVEDEVALRESIVRALREAGNVVDDAGDGRQGLYLGNEFPVDVAIVDLGLPDIPGLELVRSWREAGRTFPILILTARGRWQEKVQGLEAGADDYLVKPIHLQEVQARLKALVRRASGWADPTMSAGDIVLDTTTQRVHVGGQSVELTAYEYRLLEFLMVHAGAVVSKSDLAEHLYDDQTDRDSNVLEVLLARLRRKLDPGGTMKPIETLRGRGYRLRLERETP